MAQKRTSSPLPVILILVALLAGLAATNPDAARLKDAMRSQKDLTLKAASLLPVKRENYILFSKLTLQYGIGEKVCWGAAYTVFICP
ncbi:MAG: hypothetical protein MUF14_07550 [Hyphomonadaceae bacterium]|jgi:hypothetical protein|nr:hypothetical protein [Hyphomonadaceae bacterium]